jgi:phage terminase large subunit
VENEYKYKPTTAFWKIKKLIKEGLPQFKEGEQKVFIIQGGQGAGKTISIEMLLIDLMELEECEMTICSAELSKLKDTALNDYIKIRKDYGLFNERSFNRSSSTYTYGEGHFTEFIGLDKTDVGKGRRRKLVFINEANKITIHQFTDIAARAEIVILDYNPDAEFWVEELKTPFNFINLTFEDNEYLPLSERNNILAYKKRGYNDEGEIISEYWANKWRVYGLGEVGILEGAVYENWEILPELPKEARILGGGIDFGWVHPQAAIAAYEYNGRKVYDEVEYGSMRGTELMGQAILDRGLERENWYCDNAAPELIDKLSDMGIDASPCSGKTGLINLAIDKMSQDTFYVTARSKNIISELYKYEWDERRDGTVTGKPVKVGDDAMNAIQYFEGTEGKYGGNYSVSRI